MISSYFHYTGCSHVGYRIHNVEWRCGYFSECITKVLKESHI